MLIDTHAHLNFNAYKDDADEVIKRALENNVWMINVGSQYTTSKRAVEIAEKYEKGVYAAIGLHPIHLETRLVKVKVDPEEIEFKTQEENFDYEKYQELAKSESRLIGDPPKRRVVAIGEIGLDYYYRPKTKRKLELFKEKQRTVLYQQLNLAKELNLPVIFHCRMAHEELIELLKNHLAIKPFNHLRGVIHCFTGTWEQAQKYLEMGLYLGFNGIIFKLEVAETSSHLSSHTASPCSPLDEIIKKTPLDKILIETDCPYLTPSLMTGRNEPLYLKYIAEKIAEIKNLSYEEIAKITTENAKKLFKI